MHIKAGLRFSYKNLLYMIQNVRITGAGQMISAAVYNP